MKTKVIILVSALAVFGFLGSDLALAESPVDQLIAARNWDLADAYYKVGQKFVQLGDKARGEEFMAAAKQIYPGYRPGSHAPATKEQMTLPPPVAPLKSVPVIPAVVTQNLQGEKIVRFEFSQLLSAYLEGDTTVLPSLIDSNMIVTGHGGQPLTVSAAQAQAQAQDFLQKNPPVAVSPEQIFQMKTLTISAVPQSVGPSYLVSIDTQPKADASLTAMPFWGPHLTFLFNRVGDNWKLSAVGTP